MVRGGGWKESRTVVSGGGGLGFGGVVEKVVFKALGVIGKALPFILSKMGSTGGEGGEQRPDVT